MKNLLTLAMVALFVALPTIARAEQVHISGYGVQNGLIDIGVSYSLDGKPTYFRGEIAPGDNNGMLLLLSTKITDFHVSGGAMVGTRKCSGSWSSPKFEARVKVYLRCEYRKS
jgi:hypothetical protein